MIKLFSRIAKSVRKMFSKSNQDVSLREGNLRYIVSDKELLDRLVKIAKDNGGHLPASSHIANRTTFDRRFGSIKRAAKLAGVMSYADYINSPAGKKAKREADQEKIKNKQEKLLKEILECRRKIGRRPRIVEMDRPWRFTYTFGSWHKALVAAYSLLNEQEASDDGSNVDYSYLEKRSTHQRPKPTTSSPRRRKNTRYPKQSKDETPQVMDGGPIYVDKMKSDEEIIDELRDFRHIYGCRPVMKDFINRDLFINRFGSWKTALKLAGYTEEDISKQNPRPPRACLRCGRKHKNLKYCSIECRRMSDTIVTR